MFGDKKLMAEEKLAKIGDREEKKKEETIVRKRMRGKGRENGNGFHRYYIL